MEKLINKGIFKKLLFASSISVLIMVSYINNVNAKVNITSDSGVQAPGGFGCSHSVKTTKKP